MSGLIDQQVRSGRTIRLGSRLLAGDPSLVVASPTQYVVPYLPNASLPPDAVLTSFNDRDLHLWTIPDDRAIYVGTPGQLERHGRIRGGEILHTDCG